MGKARNIAQLSVNSTGGLSNNTGAIVSETAKTATGTSVDFTGIPSWVKRITVMFSGVSTNGTSAPLLMLGAGSVEATGYVSGTTAVGNTVVGSLVTSTSGILAASSAAAANNINGAVVFSFVNGTSWVAQGNIYDSGGATFIVAGSKTLSSTLDRIRITTVNGTDVFDAGTINILYE